jgi:hypothetical protein
MKRFCQQVLDVEGLGEFAAAGPLKIAAGYACYTQVVGSFDRSVSVDQEPTAVDRIALTIGLADYDSERKWLETLGLTVVVEEHQWVNWWSLYFDAVFSGSKWQSGRTGLLRYRKKPRREGIDFQLVTVSALAWISVPEPSDGLSYESLS